MPGIVILGAAGAIGRSLGDELVRRNIPFTAVGRDRARLQNAFPESEIRTADLADPEQAAAAVRGATTAFYTVGVDYRRFQLHPVLMRTTLAACASAGVERLVAVSSVYSYGWPRMDRVSESHPRDPQTRKGRWRKEQEDLVIDANWTGRVRGAVVHLPDFYGPYADQSLANPILGAALDDKSATWLGSVDLPHEFVYVPDVGAVLLDLAGRNEAFGHRWNLAGAGTITAREFIRHAYVNAGHTPKWRAVGKGMLRLAGVFSPFLRELVEMQYLAETPVILDDTRLRGLLGDIKKTSYPDGVDATLNWMRAGND